MELSVGFVTFSCTDLLHQLVPFWPIMDRDNEKIPLISGDGGDVKQYVQKRQFLVPKPSFPCFGLILELRLTIPSYINRQVGEKASSVHLYSVATGCMSQLPL
jgi:hypothetical protein